jgi:hypothetical protein
MAHVCGIYAHVRFNSPPGSPFSALSVPRPPPPTETQARDRVSYDLVWDSSESLLRGGMEAMTMSENPQIYFDLVGAFLVDRSSLALRGPSSIQFSPNSHFL